MQLCHPRGKNCLVLAGGMSWGRMWNKQGVLARNMLNWLTLGAAAICFGHTVFFTRQGKSWPPLRLSVSRETVLPSGRKFVFVIGRISSLPGAFLFSYVQFFFSLHSIHYIYIFFQFCGRVLWRRLVCVVRARLKLTLWWVVAVQK